MFKFIPPVITFICLISSTLTYSQTTPLYLNLNSHNEETDFEIGQFGGYDNDSMTYVKYRNFIKMIADSVFINGAKWNFQSDWTFLQGAQNWDKGSLTANTSSKNLVKWMQENNNNRIEIDARGHYTTHNIADVAYIMTQIGVIPSPNVGGFLYYEIKGNMKGNDWRQFKNGIETEFFPYSTTNYKYTPSVLWGASSSSHQNDYATFGAWQPKFMDLVLPIDSFTVHDPTGDLLYIGNGCSSGNANDPNSHLISATTDNVDVIVNSLISFATKANDGTFPANKFYSASVQMNVRDMDSNYVAKVGRFIREVNNYMDVKPGRIIWATLSDKKDFWQNKYSSDPSDLDACNSITEINEKISFTTPFSVFPNPSLGIFHFKQNINLENLEIYDNQGRLLKTSEFSTHGSTIDMSTIKPGLYIIRIAKSNFKIMKI